VQGKNNLDSYLLMSRVDCNPLKDSAENPKKEENLDGGCLIATLYLA
jgi:hypothetical protein